MTSPIVEGVGNVEVAHIDANNALSETAQIANATIVKVIATGPHNASSRGLT